jgi:hypothetical protein
VAALVAIDDSIFICWTTQIGKKMSRGVELKLAMLILPGELEGKSVDVGENHHPPSPGGFVLVSGTN